MAVFAAGGAGLLAVVVLFTVRGLLVEVPAAPNRSETRPATDEPEKKGFALLLSLPILFFLLFFILNSSASTGIRTFSMAAMMSFHGAPPAAAGWALSGYFVGTSSGVLLGGWLADRVTRYDLPFAAVALPGCAVLALLGGIVSPRAALLPPRSAAKVLCVNGDRDSFVKLEEVEAALEPYGPQWHVLEGGGHTITDRHRELVSAFVASFG